MENLPLPDPADAPALPTTPDERAAYIKAAQQARDFKPLAALFKAELLASPRLAAVLAAYDSRSHASVIDSYALHKALLYTGGPRALQRQEQRFLMFRHVAAGHLWEIQQKKLFDLQCRWRAGEVELPGIRHTQDFQPWSLYIEHCPWVPPITADEVALYEAYLRGGTYETEYGTRWQEYDRFKRPPAAEDDDADDADPDDPTAWHFRLERKHDGDEPDHDALPAWFVFHNAHTDAGALLHRPDVRGEREEYYVQLWREEFNAQHAARLAAGPAEHRRPWAPYCHGSRATAFYINLLELPADTPRLLRWQQAAAAEDHRLNGKLREANYWYDRVLHPVAGAWPIAAHPDWRVALRQTGMSFWCHQLADVLADVWHEQEQNRLLGLPVVPPIGPKDRAPFEDVNWQDDEQERAKSILRGRELAGEPRDFNF